MPMDYGFNLLKIQRDNIKDQAFCREITGGFGKPQPPEERFTAAVIKLRNWQQCGTSGLGTELQHGNRNYQSLKKPGTNATMEEIPACRHPFILVSFDARRIYRRIASRNTGGSGARIS